MARLYHTICLYHSPKINIFASCFYAIVLQQLGKQSPFDSFNCKRVLRKESRPWKKLSGQTPIQLHNNCLFWGVVDNCMWQIIAIFATILAIFSSVYLLFLGLHFTSSLQSAFNPWSSFYFRSAICSLHFTPGPVRSLQSAFCTDGKDACYWKGL